MAHVSELKKQTVKKLQDLITEHDIIGAVNMENLPAAQLQQMRGTLRGKIDLFMTKRRLMKVAIDSIKEKKQGITEIVPHLKGMPALLFTKENPFSLFKTLKKSKSQAPAREGQIAPKNIEVKAGPTNFAPGPIIGELGSVGIKCGVEGGKVAIKSDSIVVKEGEVINKKQAEILTRLGIEPMEVGLNITAVYEKGVIYTKDVLDVDEEEFMNKLKAAATEALNLSVFAAYPTKDNVELMIQKAFNDAKTIGLEQNIIDEGIIDRLLGKAERQMLSLKSTANIDVPEKQVKEEKKDTKEKPIEEKKLEVKEEKKPVEKTKETPVTKKEAEEKKPEVKKKEPETKKAQEEKKPEVKEEIKEKKLKEPAPKVSEEKIAFEEKKIETKGVEPGKEPKVEIVEMPKEEKSTQRETPKEQEVLEKEKEIIQEEKRLEIKEEPKIEAPIEKEVQEVVKEEEEKQLEKERIKTEKEFEKVSKPETTEDKVAEMVAKMKKRAVGKEPTAEKIVEEIIKEAPKPKEKVPSIHELDEKKKKEEHKKAEELAKQLLRKGTLR
jgi:large subunit ribosomal protein L10